MDVDEYVQSGENVYCQTEASMSGSETDGQLAVTDTRLVYVRELPFSDSRVLDIGLDSIVEIRYSEQPLNYIPLFLGFLIVIVTILFGVIGPNFPDIYDEIGVMFIGVGLLAAVSLVLIGILGRSQRLEITTTADNHAFKNGDFEKFPHAIRGNSK